MILYEFNDFKEATLKNKRNIAERHYAKYGLTIAGLVDNFHLLVNTVCNFLNSDKDSICICVDDHKVLRPSEQN